MSVILLDVKLNASLLKQVNQLSRVGHPIPEQIGKARCVVFEFVDLCKLTESEDALVESKVSQSLICINHLSPNKYEGSKD